MAEQLALTGPNKLGAFYSFLRVLATNIATALLPLFVSPDSYPAGKALTIAVIVSALLTVANYVRPGEIRFGTTGPNVVKRDDGRGTLELIGSVLAVVGTIVLLLILLNVILASANLAILCVVIGVVLILLGGTDFRR